MQATNNAGDFDSANYKPKHRIALLVVSIMNHIWYDDTGIDSSLGAFVSVWPRKSGPLVFLAVAFSDIMVIIKCYAELNAVDDARRSAAQQ